MSEYHLRVSVKHDDAIKVLNDFMTAFKPIEVVCFYENKNYARTYISQCPGHENCKITCFNENEIIEEEINPHIHTYLKYDKIPTKQKVSEFFKSQPILKAKNVAGYYHKKQSGTTEDNIVYVIKNNHCVYKNIDIEKYKIKSEKINLDKKLSSKEKLYNRYIERFGLEYPSSKFEIFKFIDEIYVNEWDKSPLAMNHMMCYSRHILCKLHKNIINKNDKIYELLLLNIYNINNHRELIHDLNEELAAELCRKETKDYLNCDFIDETD